MSITIYDKEGAIMGFSRVYDLKPAEYVKYELSVEQKRSLRAIERFLLRMYRSRATRNQALAAEKIISCINYLLHLEQKISVVLENEKNIGYNNHSLKLHYNHIKNLIRRLEIELELCQTGRL